MGSKSPELHYSTSPEWIKTVLNDFDSFLVDHACCERKANALLMSMVAKYPDRKTMIPQLIALALEELEHFAEAYAFMEKRGLQLGKDEPDPYVQKLLASARHGRDERLIDRMLISSVIEQRGAERFRIVAEHVGEPELAEFYERLWKAEIKHAHVFVHMLHKEYEAEIIDKRLEQITAIEAEICSQLKLRPALH